jgi:streptogramin lyase
MKTKIFSAVLIAIVLLAGEAEAQIYDTNNEVVSTFAGFGIPGYVDGQGQLTAFSSPSQIVSDTASNLYVWDSGNARIRKLTPDGTVTTFAGGGSYFDGYGTNVSLGWGSVGTMAIDHANTLWLVLVSGYSGQSYLVTISTNGYVSIANGGLTNLGTGSGLCFDSADNLYYSGGNRIYRYPPGSGIAQAIAGSGINGNFDGQGTLFSAFNNPAALACDQADNLYVWDSGNATIRRVDQSQNVTTIAGSASSYNSADGVGTNAAFNGGIASMFADNQGNVYFVSSTCIRRMNAQTNVVTLAGNFSPYSGSYANGPGNLARFNNASGGCFSQGMIFVADTGNNRIRSLAFDPQTQTVSPPNLQLKTYPGVQITGAIGRTYQIQSSPDMKAWNPVTTLLLTASPYLWIDQNPVAGNKFYRAVMLP